MSPIITLQCLMQGLNYNMRDLRQFRNQSIGNIACSPEISKEQLEMEVNTMGYGNLQGEVD